MPELRLRLPAASPHAYLAWVAWWRDVEVLMGAESLAPDTAVPAQSDGGVASAPQGIVLAHVLAIEAQAREAIREGKDEMAPELIADGDRWQEWIDYGRSRNEWVQALALKGLPAPEVPSDIVRLWQETIRTISATVSDHGTWRNLRTVTVGAGHIRLEGEIEIANVEALAELFDAELRSGHRLTLEMDGVSFIDSKGVELLVRIAAAAQQAGVGPVVLEHPSLNVRKVLEIAVPGGIEGVEVRST